MSTLEELKQEATDLGLEVVEGVTAAKLKKQIEAFYAEGEKEAAEALQKTIDTKSTTSNEKENLKEAAKLSKRHARIKAARQTKIVTIIDNDQRVNNATTTCTANCSNEFFDLGTAVLPLNEKIEVAVGHINALKEVQIPLHVRDTKTGLSTVRLRPRYSITEESI